jgi:hypothetical protein
VRPDSSRRAPKSSTDSGSGFVAPTQDVKWVVSRRQFIGVAASLSLVGVLVDHDPVLHEGLVPEFQLLGDSPKSLVIIQAAHPILDLTVERDTDLFLANFTFCGFTFEKRPGGVLTLVASAAKATDTWIGVIVQLPPQSVAEGDYEEEAPGKLQFDPKPILSQVAGPTRLAFTFQHGDTIPLPTKTVADLIDWGGWDLNVTDTSISGTSIVEPTKPTGLQTWIEAPVGLVLSPVTYNSVLGSKYNYSTRFSNRTEPLVSSRDVVDCWTTSLVSSVFTDFNLHPLTTALTPSVAAVWATDYDVSAPGLLPENYIQYDLYEAPPK